MYNANAPTAEELPSTGQLVRSTIIALLIAAVLLIGVVLPAEYGIDPTRVGRILGLTQMGEVKQQLAEEAAADAELAVAVPQTVPEPQPEPVAAPTIQAGNEPAVAGAQPSEAIEPVATAPEWTDERTVTLAPDAAAEVKLVMNEGSEAEYEWSVDGGHLNYDLHADYPQGGGFHSYKKGRAVTADEGSFSAEFDGAHGWYWRNRSGQDVTVTLRVRGDYAEVKKMM